MKKNLKKLSIKRETIVNLGRFWITGGATSTCGNTAHGCNPTDFCSAMNCDPTQSVGVCTTRTND